MTTDQHVTVDLHIDTSGLERALLRGHSQVLAVGSLHTTAREFEEAMERIRVLTDSSATQAAAIAKQIHQLTLTSGRTLREATDTLLANGPWHWDWTTPGSEWPWVTAARRTRMHAAYRAKTRRRNRR